MNRIESSFRDNSGWVYEKNGVVYRHINKCYENEYRQLMESGLYRELVNNNLLISHKEIEETNDYRVIMPEQIKYISYPYEWCFDEYKDAALLTLSIAKMALQYDMILKDASSYNIQFKDCKSIFIDTLSFDIYKEGQFWDAYGQFCRHFLAPLALMSNIDIRMALLMREFIDGIPLDLAVKLLPKKKKYNISYYIHIYLQAKEQSRYQENRDLKAKTMYLPKKNLIGIIDNLAKMISNMKIRQYDSEWLNYYLENNYSDRAFTEKVNIVSKFINIINPKKVCDLGANTGEFSAIAAKNGASVVAYDIDVLAVNAYYNHLKAKNEQNILPLIVDLTNPTPAIGWANEERKSMLQREKWDCVLVLALVHHLSIANNVPFYKIAELLYKITTYLIIEFVPKEDSQVSKMLTTRKDIFDFYNQEQFEKEFKEYFDIIEKENIIESKRTMYLMRRKVEI